jgi:hypothetical protein
VPLGPLKYQMQILMLGANADNVLVVMLVLMQVLGV